MIEPEAALVTPRVIWPDTGDAVPIDEIFVRMHGQPTGAIEIVGRFGSGKTTALRHLAAVAPPEPLIAWIEGADLLAIAEARKQGWAVFTSTGRRTYIVSSSFHLAGWGDDELIEYLLAAHPEQCQSVILRIGQAADRQAIGDSPMLWRIVLDQMARHESICSVDDALWRQVMRAFPEGEIRRLAEHFCFARLTPNFSRAEEAWRKLAWSCAAEELRLLYAPRIRLLLAAELVVRWLEGAAGGELPSTERLVSLFGWIELPKTQPLVFPHPLLLKIAESVADSPRALERLGKILSEDDCYLHSMAASILHAGGTGWILERRTRARLDGAYLRGAVWPGIDLRGLEMNVADLSTSNLARANLDRAQAHEARFERAMLREASLVEISADGADFSRADLTRANLRDASLVGARLRQATCDMANFSGAKLRSADLTGASFVGANLQNADLYKAMLSDTVFTRADLERTGLHGLDLRGATFDQSRLVCADLGRCNLEGMRFNGVDFTGVKLSHALLSDSVMRGCTLRRAKLNGAGIAGIEWENVDLGSADLRGAVFHLGTSRSGLVDSPLASEGTRTGFYTDDFDLQSFQAPEDIRKANLCGADLRGAKIEGVDFYLVDLRGARYDTDQFQHFRRCRAILADRA